MSVSCAPVVSESAKLIAEPGTIGEMGIYKRSQRQQWVEKALPRLGKETDTAIAVDLGVTARQVGYLRAQVNKQPACRARWQAVPITKSLGVVPDKELAEKLGVSVSAVKRRRQERELKFERKGMPPEAKEVLGKIPDMEVALRFGRSYDTARNWRIAHQLPAVIIKRSWTSAEIAKLGTMPDTVLARELVRRPRAVTLKREQLGIPAYRA